MKLDVNNIGLQDKTYASGLLKSKTPVFGSITCVRKINSINLTKVFGLNNLELIWLGKQYSINSRTSLQTMVLHRHMEITWTLHTLIKLNTIGIVLALH